MLELKKKELDNLRIANTGQGRSITPSTFSLISENEKVNVEKAQPKFSLSYTTRHFHPMLELYT